MWHFVRNTLLFQSDFPKHSLALTRGTDTSCVCVIHQSITFVEQEEQVTGNLNARILVESMACSTKNETCFNTVSRLPSPWCNTEATLYDGTFLIWRKITYRQ
jgi:hypothetical protein